MRLPFNQRALQSFFDVSKPNTGGEQLAYIQDAMGAQGIKLEAIRCAGLGRPTLPERWFANTLDHRNHLLNAHCPWISHVIDAIGSTTIPKLQAGPHTVVQMGEGINSVTEVR